MSVATKSYVSSYGNNQHTDQVAQRPRSPAPNYMPQSQRMNASYSSQESSLKRPSPSAEEDEHRDKRQKIGRGDQRTDPDLSIAPTNHERRAESDIADSQNGLADSQRSQLDQSGGPALSKLGKDVGEAFLLCRSVVPLSRPDPNQHLLATFGLGDLLRSVARVDPLTGEKINKLRKSYEGQIKTFALPGRNKPFKAEKENKDEPGPLRRLGMIPDDRWQHEQGSSEININDEFREKLKLALQVQPGKVRNNAQWEDILGHEKPRPNMQAASVSSGRIPNGQAKPPSALAGDKRSTRGNRRSYGDDSFVGYGDTFSDGDDGAAEDEDDYAKRKRKKSLAGHLNR